MGTRLAMATRPSTARYTGGGKTKYLVYRSPQPLRSGETQERTRVQRLYFPASAEDIKLDRPGTVEKRTGTRVYGVAVGYRHKLAGATAHRKQTTYQLPERWSKRVKIVELPEGARDLRLTDRPPSGPLVAVR